jgi:hypothetical protein
MNHKKIVFRADSYGLLSSYLYFYQKSLKKRLAESNPYESGWYYDSPVVLNTYLIGVCCFGVKFYEKNKNVHHFSKSFLNSIKWKR